MSKEKGERKWQMILRGQVSPSRKGRGLQYGLLQRKRKRGNDRQRSSQNRKSELDIRLGVIFLA
jgi:hypothetical protein